MFFCKSLDLRRLFAPVRELSVSWRALRVETETQVPPEMPVSGQSIESNGRIPGYIDLAANGRSTGKLKIFRSCKNWFDEFRIFCRDKNGNIINENKFHLMASTRYLFLRSMNRWIVKPAPKAESRPEVGIWG